MRIRYNSCRCKSSSKATTRRRRRSFKDSSFASRAVDGRNRGVPIFYGRSMIIHVCIAVALLVLALDTSAPIAQEKPRIYLGASSKTLGYSPLWVGARKGFFDQQGLDVQ